MFSKNKKFNLQKAFTDLSKLVKAPAIIKSTETDSRLFGANSTLYLNIIVMKDLFKKTIAFSKSYLKSLNWIVLLGLAAFCIALAIVNKIRVEDSKSVDWIGSQEILAKPDEVL